MNKEEIKLLNEMKENCLNGAKYIDPKAMDKYNLLRKLEDENKELHNKIDKVIKRIELLGKFDGEHCTRNFKMMSADFNYLLEILKESDVDE